MILDSIKVERNDAVLEITIDRPKANAIDAATSRRMGEVFRELRDSPDFRVAILTGAGERFFSAGWDLGAAAEGEAYEAEYGVGGFGGISELPGLDKPVIAALNGLAVGGGFEIALACDLVIAAQHVELMLPEVRVGLMPDSGSIRLPRKIPYAIAMEMLLTGRRMNAQEAARWGLVNAVVPAGDLLAEARRLATEIVRGAPLGVASVKEAVRETEGLGISDAYRKLRSGELSAYQRMLRSEDALEGPRAFAEKREPVWRGQ